jgi:hypothetical protein
MGLRLPNGSGIIADAFETQDGGELHGGKEHFGDARTHSGDRDGSEGWKTSKGFSWRLQRGKRAARTRVQAEFVVSLNTKLGSGGTAQMIDETAASAPTAARKSGNKYVFGPVQFVEPGASARRVFRITNIRADVTGLPSRSSALMPVVASISIPPPADISLVNAEQPIASIASDASVRTR